MDKQLFRVICKGWCFWTIAWIFLAIVVWLIGSFLAWAPLDWWNMPLTAMRVLFVVYLCLTTLMTFFYVMEN